MRALKFSGALLLVCLLPAVALAQSASNPQVSSLLAEISALEQQINSLAGTSTAASSSGATPTPASAMCPALSRTLSLGSSGADVANLQAFLAEQGVFSAASTGYFGTLTQASVEQWQEAHGVVSGGDANSTGLGVVGPKTRAAIESSCGGTIAQSTSCLPTESPQAECPTGWQPVPDASGCTAYYKCSIPLPATTSPATAPSSTPAACPVVSVPSCSGTVSPFQTNSSGCVVSYECVL